MKSIILAVDDIRAIVQRVGRNALMDELNWPMGATLSFVMLIMLGTIVIIYNRIMGLSQIYKSFG